MSPGATAFFGGFRIVDVHLTHADAHVQHVDVAVVVVGWEDRSSYLLQRGLLSGSVCFLISFADDGISDERHSMFFELASRLFATVTQVFFSSAYEVELLMTDVERFSRRLGDLKPRDCAVDYSSMPRVVTQTLFRTFMLEGICPQVHWLYSTGLYDGTSVCEDGFNQGVEDFFAVRGVDSFSGISTRRVAVLALGAERSLISAFMRQSTYDVVHVFDAVSESSPELSAKIREQRKWMRLEHSLSEDAFIECRANSVVGILQQMIAALRHFGDDTGTLIEIFCSGPKSQAVAASALVNVYRNIRLTCRRPTSYSRVPVLASGEITITTVSDFTNPRIVDALMRLDAHQSSTA